MANSAQVNVGDTATASQYNNLRKDDVTNALKYYALAGSANAFTVTVDAQYAALTDGSKFTFKANFTITGAPTVTITPSGASALTAKTIKNIHGGALRSGDIVSGEVFEIEYNSADDCFYLLTPKGVQDDYVVTTGSANAFVLAIGAKYTAYQTGDLFTFNANFTITGAPTLNVNSIGAKTIVKADGSGLVSGDIISGQIVSVRYNGTNMQLMGPAVTSGKITVNATTTTVTATTTETDLASFTLPGGKLSTANAMRLRMHISSLGVNNGANVTFRLKYAGGTIATVAPGNSNGTTASMSGEIMAELLASGATNTQVAGMRLRAEAAEDFAGGSLGGSAIAGTGTGTGAVDSTADQTFKITVQFSSASGNNTVTVTHYIADMIA